MVMASDTIFVTSVHEGIQLNDVVQLNENLDRKEMLRGALGRGVSAMDANEEYLVVGYELERRNNFSRDCAKVEVRERHDTISSIGSRWLRVSQVKFSVGVD